MGWPFSWKACSGFWEGLEWRHPLQGRPLQGGPCIRRFSRSGRFLAGAWEVFRGGEKFGAADLLSWLSGPLVLKFARRGALDPPDALRIHPEKNLPVVCRASTTRFRVIPWYLASRGCYSTPGCGKAGKRPGSTCAIDVEGHKRRPPSKVGGLCHEFRV